MEKFKEVRAITYSGLSAFLTCPRKYYAQYIEKIEPFVKTDAMKFGDRVHIALEERVAYGKPVPYDLRVLEGWASLFDKFRMDKRYKVTTENNRAVDRQGSFVPHREWGRKFISGKDDLTIILGDKAASFDYKTGKVKQDEMQLRMQAHLLFAEYPQVNYFSGSFIYLQHGVVTPPVNLVRGSEINKELADGINTLDAAHWAKPSKEFVSKNGYPEAFPPTKNGLCKNYCPVKTCRFNGGFKVKEI